MEYIIYINRVKLKVMDNGNDALHLLDISRFLYGVSHPR